MKGNFANLLVPYNKTNYLLIDVWLLPVVHSVHHYVPHHKAGLDHILAKSDHSNAFNHVCRHAVLQAVEALCLAILPWVAYTLCQRNLLYLDTFLLISFSGVQQGDPFQPLLFALAIHPLVCQLSSIPRFNISTWFLYEVRSRVHGRVSSMPSMSCIPLAPTTALPQHVQDTPLVAKPGPPALYDMTIVRHRSGAFTPRR